MLKKKILGLLIAGVLVASTLWYLTRPMTDYDIAVIHTFQQSSE